MAEWALQFPIEKTRSYAARFPSGNDDAVLAIGSAARRRGHYLRDEFISVCKWKSERSRSYAARNTARAVEAATRVALSEESTERERMKALRSLNGVDWATASVLLHLAYPERYPILDQRARSILHMRYEHDLLQADIAMAVGLSQMHVSRVISSSLERLSTYAAGLELHLQPV